MRPLRPVLLLVLLIASVPGVAQAPPAAARALVDEAQQAVIWWTTGQPYRFWLIRLTPEEVVVKNAPGDRTTKTWTAASKRVKAVRLGSGLTFALHPRTNKFTRYDELTGTFEDSSRLQEEKDTPPPLIHEVAEGIGKNGDEAIRDALRNAVRQAIGVIVDDEVLIEKEDVISNKVLTFSEGFVTRYDELSRQTKNGLVHVRISAQIEPRKLLANLRKAEVSVSSIEGKDLVASAQTRKEARDTATKLLGKKLAQLPNLLEVEVRKPGTLDYDAETQLLTLTADVRVDLDRYLAYSAALESLASKLAVAKTNLVCRTQPCFGNAEHLLCWSQATLCPGLRFGPDLRGNPKTWCLWLATRYDKHASTVRFTAFALDTDVARSMQGLRGQVRAQIDLVDADGKVIQSDAFDPMPKLRWQSYLLGWMVSRPRQSAESRDESPFSLFAAKDGKGQPFAIGEERTVNAYIIPKLVAGLEKGNILYAKGAWQTRQIRIAPDTLKRMTEVKARIVFTPEKANGSSPSSTPRR